VQGNARVQRMEDTEFCPSAIYQQIENARKIKRKLQVSIIQTCVKDQFKLLKFPFLLEMKWIQAALTRSSVGIEDIHEIKDHVFNYIDSLNAKDTQSKAQFIRQKVDRDDGQFDISVFLRPTKEAT
jgi:hypothetical protein